MRGKGSPILRNLGLMTVFCIAQASLVFAQNSGFPEADTPLMTPPVEEKKLKEEKIDSEYIEVTPFYGLYSVEGFNASPVFGLSAALHLTEDLFFTGRYGVSKTNQASFKRLTGRPLLSDENLSYWQVNIGYNLFPGHIFLTRNRTLNSVIYLSGGAGQTEFDGRSRFTVNIGTGYKIFFTDWLDAGFRLSVHSFETDLTGEKDRMFNMEGTLNIAFFF
ncbi:MAG: outer membrane beta-barrel domain-containing protein [Nitrospiria bacterium]